MLHCSASLQYYLTHFAVIKVVFFCALLQLGCYRFRMIFMYCSKTLLLLFIAVHAVLIVSITKRVLPNSFNSCILLPLFMVSLFPVDFNFCVQSYILTISAIQFQFEDDDDIIEQENLIQCTHRLIHNRIDIYNIIIFHK